MVDLTQLAAEFPRDAVHWRIQGKPYERNGTFSAMALAYIDARDVMDRLDEVCGPENWQTKFTETAKGRVVCSIGVRVNDDWVWKSDGAGDTAVEGEKGAMSDALKRAAVAWGIGRYLYRLDAPWVKCVVNQRGDRVFWKSWAEDPWSKVKSGNYSDPTPPAFDPAAARDRIKAKLEKAPTIETLGETWRNEQAVIAEVKDASEPMFNELNKAKDDRKTTLGAQLTNQGAG